VLILFPICIPWPKANSRPRGGRVAPAFDRVGETGGTVSAALIGDMNGRAATEAAA